MANIGGLTKMLESIYNAVSPARKALLTAPSPTLRAAQGAASKLTGQPRSVEILANQAATKGGLSPARVLQMVSNAQKAELVEPKALSTMLKAPERYMERAKNPTIADDGVLAEESAYQLMFKPHALPDSIKQSMLDIYAENLGQAGLLQQPGIQSIFKSENLDKKLDKLQQVVTEAQSSGAVPGLRQNTVDSLFRHLADDVIDDLLARTEHYAKAMPELPLEQNYSDMQRQSFPGIEDAKAFGTALRGPDNTNLPDWDPSYGHFLNNAMYGHIRGAILPDSRVLVEELQSDPLKFNKKTPELQGIYGQLAKGLLERTLETPAKSLIIPEPSRLHGDPQFMQDIYGRQLGKQFYGPLSEAGLRFKLENGFNILDLDDETKRILKTNPELLGFKTGGLAQATKR